MWTWPARMVTRLKPIKSSWQPQVQAILKKNKHSHPMIHLWVQWGVDQLGLACKTQKNKHLCIWTWDPWPSLWFCSSRHAALWVGYWRNDIRVVWFNSSRDVGVVWFSSSRYVGVVWFCSSRDVGVVWFCSSRDVGVVWFCSSRDVEW